MLTNLVFKRVVNVNGINKTEMKVVKVDIPQIERGEGWTLSGHADSVDISDMAVEENKREPLLPGCKFESSETGCAKLVRVKNSVFIAYRKGKTTYNQNTPDSVCISDIVKQEFFNDTRGKTEFKLRPVDGELYNYWNKFIDDEYMRQLVIYNSRLTAETFSSK